jgi:hypothetical protein
MTVNSRLNAEEIEVIRKRAEDTSFERAYVKGDPWKGYEVRDGGNGIAVAETSTKVDAEFIAHARQDVPKLLAEIERLSKTLDYINDLAGEFFTVEDEEGVFSIPNEQPHKDTMQEIFVISYEAVNADD